MLGGLSKRLMAIHTGNCVVANNLSRNVSASLLRSEIGHSAVDWRLKNQATQI